MKKQSVIFFFCWIFLITPHQNGSASTTPSCPYSVMVSQKIESQPSPWAVLPGQETKKELNLFAIRITIGHPSERGFLRGIKREYKENDINFEETVYALDKGFDHYVVCSYVNTFATLIIPIDEDKNSCRVYRSSVDNPFYDFECR